MSRDAFERTVGRVMSDPHGQKMGEEKVRRMVQPVAERADKDPPPKPLSRKEYERRVDKLDSLNPRVVRVRAPIDRDSKLHWDLDHDAGLAPPRLGLHGAPDRTAAAETHRSQEARVRNILERR